MVRDDRVVHFQTGFEGEMYRDLGVGGTWGAEEETVWS